MQADEMITVGRIVAPHGVRGDLRILPDTDRPEIFKTLKHLYIDQKPFERLQGRPHKNIYIVHLASVDDRNEAETLVGKLVTVPFGELPPRPEGEHFYFEIIGLSVEEEDGTVVGTIKEILETGANDVYVVEEATGKELCLPVIPSCVLAVEPEQGRVIVRLPEWDS